MAATETAGHAESPDGFRVATAYVDVAADPGSFIRTLRIIAKHYTALADELEAKPGFIEVPCNWTPEQVAEFEREWAARYGDGKATPRL
jgi:hypothetical protein